MRRTEHRIANPRGGKTAARALPLAAAALILALAAPAQASVKDGVDMWTHGDYAGAVQQWQGPAAAGDADAQFNLGQAYKLGRGVKQDLKKAEELFHKSAMQGHLEAGDNYGLMLFQSGERDEALPWLKASAERGEPRAEYVLGIAHFNGDLVAKDWVKAYALMSRAAASGLPQANKSLKEMDKLIPLDERQKGVALAGQMGRRADQLRETQIAAADLGTQPMGTLAADDAMRQMPPSPVARTAVPASHTAEAAKPKQAVTAGADYADPVVLSSRDRRAGNTVHVHSNETPTHAAAPAAATPRAAQGPWRVQLGAFSQPGNATALWNRVKGRAELSGLARFDVTRGGVTRLQAGPFASQAAAARTCARLKAAGLACLPVHR